MEIEVTSKITGFSGNVILRPKVKLEAKLETSDAGRSILWFMHDSDIRGPITLYPTVLPGPINNPSRLLEGSFDPDQIQEIHFYLHVEEPKVIVFLTIDKGEFIPLEYEDGIAWQDGEHDINQFLDLGWFMARPGNDFTANRYAKLRTDTHRRVQHRKSVKV